MPSFLSISLTLSLSVSFNSLNIVLSLGFYAPVCLLVNSSRNANTLSVSSIKVAILTDCSYC